MRCVNHAIITHMFGGVTAMLAFPQKMRCLLQAVNARRQIKMSRDAGQTWTDIKHPIAHGSRHVHKQRMGVDALQLAPTFATTGNIIVKLAVMGVMLGNLRFDTGSITDITYSSSLSESPARPFSVGGRQFGDLWSCPMRSFGNTLAFSPGYESNGKPKSFCPPF